MGLVQGSGPLVTILASCLPGLQLRHGLLAQEWTSRHEQGPQPAAHRPAPQRHWSVPPLSPWQLGQSPAHMPQSPGTQFSTPTGYFPWLGGAGKGSGVRGEWNQTIAKGLSKQCLGGGWV